MIQILRGQRYQHSRAGMAQAYALEPSGPAGRYHVPAGFGTQKLADPQNPPYDKGRTFTERLGRMGREIP
jgi:hypothetical protein